MEQCWDTFLKNKNEKKREKPRFSTKEKTRKNETFRKIKREKRIKNEVFQKKKRVKQRLFSKYING